LTAEVSGVYRACMRGHFAAVVVLTAGPVAATAQETAKPPHASLLRVAAHAAGGALVGAWGGYMTSQVTWSDWQNREGRGAQRIRFSVTGAALGLIAGVIIGRSGGGDAAPERRHVALADDTRPITAEEIRYFPGRTVAELLRALRPQWLRRRGPSTFRPDADPLTPPGIRVYLEGGLLGGLEVLDQVPIETITGAAFLDAARATMRWGAGHPDGAILLTTDAP